jgi:hypothetical protein
MNRLRKALLSNLKEYMLMHKVVTTPKETEDFFEQFVESQVRMDIHYIRSIRRSEGGVFEAVSRTLQEGSRVVMNGMSIDSRNRQFFTRVIV